MHWRDVRKNGYCLSLLSLVLFALCSIRLSRAKEEIIKSGNCQDDFYESSPTATTDSPAWTLENIAKTCSVCNQENTKQSWFITKLFSTNNAKLVHINITMSFSSCPKCLKQSLKVLVRKKISKEMDDKKVIAELNTLPVLKEIENKTEPNIQKTYHVQFEPTSNIFSIVLLAEGACLIVHKFKLSYFFCEKASISGVSLTRTVSPASGNRTAAQARCFNNTIPPGDGKVFGLCCSDGKWGFVTPCRCKKGYTFGSNGCVGCQRDTYKSKVGNNPCLACPSNSESAPQAVTCKCKDYFYRLPGNNYTDICYGIPSKVQNVKLTHQTTTSVVIQWEPPSRKINTVFYDIECSKCQGKVCEEPCGGKTTYKPSNVNLTGMNVTVENLQPNTQYMFTVRSKNNNSNLTNPSNWLSVSIKIETEGVSKPHSTSSPITIIIPIVVVIVLVIIIIVLIVILIRRRKFKRRATMVKRRQVDLPLIGEKNYIDPTTYDDPERAVSEFAKELNRDLIKFECILGGGEFGDVYKGTLKRPGEPLCKIAIKTLKPGSTSKNRKDFLIEASVMGQFKNLNVVTLEGVVTKTIPLLIVTEFMENGSLDDYLKSNDGLLKPLQLLGMARGVASGMAYLAGMHFVHRDLAARNVLVNVNLACKVADFGLSRDIGNCEGSEYETQGGRIPVRWTAPEAIRYRKFSTASDVWSYGILLWEIVSFAERPYWDWGNLEVLERVDGGYRLPPPMNCPKIVHQLMMECWTPDRTKRPGFPEIVKIVDEWIRSPEKLKEDTIKLGRREPLDITAFSSVKDWLDAFKMGMYASNFTKAGYITLDEVTKLSEAELLAKVEVRLVGHRHKIYQRIKEMNEHMQIAREQNSVRI